MALYRNNDMEFERQMAGKTAERKIPLTMTLEAVDGGFKLNGIFFEAEHQQAQKPQRENIIRQLTKLGGTPYVCDNVELVPNDFNYFIPSSLLAEWRRQLVSSLILRRNEQHRSSESIPACECQMETYDYPHLYNAANEKSREFYAERGVSNATAMEVSPMSKRTDVEPLLMQCRHCLRYSLGYCVRKGGEKPRWQEPLYLVSGDGRRFRLEFDCRKCQMNVWGL